MILVCQRRWLVSWYPTPVFFFIFPRYLYGDPAKQGQPFPVLSISAFVPYLSSCIMPCLCDSYPAYLLHISVFFSIHRSIYLLPGLAAPRLVDSGSVHGQMRSQREDGTGTGKSTERERPLMMRFLWSDANILQSQGSLHSHVLLFVLSGTDSGIGDMVNAVAV